MYTKGMTQKTKAQPVTVTMTEDPAVCYFCKGIPTAIKQDAGYTEREQADGTVLEDGIVVELLPICDACAEHWYDGTELMPELLPLDTRP